MSEVDFYFYFYCFPVTTGVHITELDRETEGVNAKKILLEMEEFLWVQDDYPFRETK